MTLDTRRLLIAMTDPARFECLAVAVLRAADPRRYSSLSHQGVGEAGKPVKSPLDSFGWIRDATGATAVAAAHTTEKQNKLRGKWLHDPSRVTPKSRGRRPTQPAGDFIKAIAEVQALRHENPKLKALLALTSNREEPIDVRADAELLAEQHDIELDVWSGSRLADFLDTHPDGQSIRRQYFGTEIVRLSLQELLRCGVESVRVRLLGTDPALMVRRQHALVEGHTLVSGPSGMGKTTLCLNVLAEALHEGRPGIVIDNATISKALSMEEAIEIELRRFSHCLESNSGPRALQLCAESHPLLVVIEDLNRSDNPGHLLNKVIVWCRAADSSALPPWRLLCPIWPQFLAEVDTLAKDESIRRSVTVTELGLYADAEAIQAVRSLGDASGMEVDDLKALEIAHSLANDPLLIGLYDFRSRADPDAVISHYIDRTLQTVSTASSLTLTDIQDSLDSLCREMLERRLIQPSWPDVRAWLNRDQLDTLRQVLKKTRLFRLSRIGASEYLKARHDRVLTRLLADYVRREFQPDAVYLTDPYFAEVVGIACAETSRPLDRLRLIMDSNPVAAFHALRKAIDTASAYQGVAAQAIQEWVMIASHREPLFRERRQAGLAILAEIEHPVVISLTSHFPHVDWDYYFYKARLRNGDAIAGCNWLAQNEFEVWVPGRNEVIDHAIKRWGAQLNQGVAQLLEGPHLTDQQRIGSLRFAGYLAQPSLARSLRVAWQLSTSARDLESFLWAAAHVCTDASRDLYDAIYVQWESMGHRRDRMAAHGLAWNFRRRPPSASISYFVQRAQSVEELKWPTVCLLSGVDHPDAVQYIAEYFADLGRRSQGTDSARSFVRDQWERRADRVMSQASKTRLLALSTDQSGDHHLREEAFSLWETSIAPGDLPVARAIGEADVRYDAALWTRARRGDVSVIPEIIPKLRSQPSYWWQAGRYIWNEAMTQEYRQAILAAMSPAPSRPNLFEEIEWLMTELLLRQTPETVEDILLPIWDHLDHRPPIVAIALCVESTVVQQLAADALCRSTKPADLLKDFGMSAGIRMQGGWNPINPAQIDRLLPYLDLLADEDIVMLWNLCRNNGWHSYAHTHIEPVLQTRNSQLVHQTLERKDIWTSLLDLGLGDKPDVRVYTWFDTHLRRGFMHDQVIAELLSWFNRQRSDRAAFVVANILGPHGTRRDLEAFLRLADGLLSGVQQLLPALRFSIYRRTVA